MWNKGETLEASRRYIIPVEGAGWRGAGKKTRAARNRPNNHEVQHAKERVADEGKV